MARVEFILCLLTLACLVTVAYSGSCRERLMSGCGENITITLSIGPLTTAPPSVQYLTAPPLDQSTTDRTSCQSITPLPTPSGKSTTSPPSGQSSPPSTPPSGQTPMVPNADPCCNDSSVTKNGVFGFDVSFTVKSLRNFRRLYGCGYRFVIIHAYGNSDSGTVDLSAADNIKYARTAGFTRVDVYMLPVSPDNKPIHEQVNEMVTALMNNNYNQIWIDIEGPRWWPTNQAQNQQFICNLLDEFERRLPNKTVGIYTNHDGWTQIMGNADFMWGNQYISSRQLWFADYDDITSFNTNLPPWSIATTIIKQFNQNRHVCDVLLDENVCRQGYCT